MDVTSIHELQRSANEQLQLHFHRDRHNEYDTVVVLLVYWEITDQPGFGEEAMQLQQLFETKFNYVVRHFRIPPEDSHLALDEEIGRFVRNTKALNALSIIHYGGHGDENTEDQHGAPGRGVSVWAATGSGVLMDDNSLTWSDIQPKLKHTNQDVLLLLDCCFAARAARATHRVIPENVELLAACSMTSETPGPGPARWSFTQAIIKELALTADQNKGITIGDLHHRLASKDGQLITTPVHFSLATRKRTIYLHSIIPQTSASPPSQVSELRLRMILNNSVSANLVDEVVSWLRTNAPIAVSGLEITEILNQALSLKQFVGNTSSNEASEVRLGSQLTPMAKQEVRIAWDELLIRLEARLRLLLSSIDIHRTLNPVQTEGFPMDEFLQDFESIVSAFQRIAERNLLQLPVISEGPGNQAVDKTFLSRIGMEEALKVKQSTNSFTFPNPTRFSASIAVSVDTPDLLFNGMNPLSVAEIHGHGRVLVEYKYIDDRDAEIARASFKQVQRLASVLQQVCGPRFRTPRCLGFESHTTNTDQQKCMLVFEEPFPGFEHINLYSLLEEHSRGNSSRFPSLGQRFALAHSVGQALLKWHTTDWLHQSISSYNIVFFVKNKEEIDYSQPFLCGFDHSRQVGHLSTQRDSQESKLHDIYRHPDRQGYPAVISHTKKHDIYSFGLVLLEIGLWTSLPTALKNPLKSQGPTCVKSEMLRRIPSSRLAHDMGSAYVSIILTCIHGELGGETDDSAQSQMMRDFDHRVLEKLALGTRLDE